MSSSTRVAAWVVVAIAGVGGAPASLPAQASATESSASSSDSSITNGKTLFNTVGCWSCHGFSGQGAMSRGIASGPHINARVLPEAAFIHQLRAPVGVMPPYTVDVLSDQQASDIYNYLRSLPEPPALKDIPLLNAP